MKSSAAIILFLVAAFMSSVYAESMKKGESISLASIQSLEENDGDARFFGCLLEASLLNRGLVLVERLENETLARLIRQSNIPFNSMTVSMHQLSVNRMGGNYRINCRSVERSDYAFSITIKDGSTQAMFKSLQKAIAKNTLPISNPRFELPKDEAVILVPIGVPDLLTASFVRAFQLSGNPVILDNTPGSRPVNYILFLYAREKNGKHDLVWKIVDARNWRIVRIGIGLNLTGDDAIMGKAIKENP